MRSEAGQSLIEVIVATTVGILVVTALTFATIFSLRNASFAKNSSQATKLAQEGLEKIRTLRDRNGPVNYSGVSDFNGLWPITFYCPANCYFYFSGSVLTGGSSFDAPISNFRRSVIMEDSGVNQKKVSVIVTWTDFAGPHESKLTTIFRKL